MIFTNFQITHRLTLAKAWAFTSVGFLLFGDAMLIQSTFDGTVDYTRFGIKFYDAYFWAVNVFFWLLWASRAIRQWQTVKQMEVARTNVV